MTAKLSIPLSDEELEELDQFLMSEAVSDEAMVLDTLDGYLTAIVIGPATIPPADGCRASGVRTKTMRPSMNQWNRRSGFWNW